MIKYRNLKKNCILILGKMFNSLEGNIKHILNNQ